MADSYYGRLAFRTWRETRNVWTAYRFWLSIAPPIAAVLVLVYRKGAWSAIMNASDVLINGTAGAAIAFVGTFILSLIRSPRLLDDDRASAQSRLEETISEQSIAIDKLRVKPIRTPAEQHHYDLARAAINQHGSNGVAALRQLRLHGRIIFGSFQPTQPPQGMTIQDFRGILNALTGSHVVTVRQVFASPGNPESTYTLTPGIEAAMDELLYPNSSDNSHT